MKSHDSKVVHISINSVEEFEKLPRNLHTLIKINEALRDTCMHSARILFNTQQEITELERTEREILGGTTPTLNSIFQSHVLLTGQIREKYGLLSEQYKNLTQHLEKQKNNRAVPLDNEEVDLLFSIYASHFKDLHQLDNELKKIQRDTDKYGLILSAKNVGLTESIESIVVNSADEFKKLPKNIRTIAGVACYIIENYQQLNAECEKRYEYLLQLQNSKTEDSAEIFKELTSIMEDYKKFNLESKMKNEIQNLQLFYKELIEHIPSLSNDKFNSLDDDEINLLYSKLARFITTTNFFNHAEKCESFMERSDQCELMMAKATKFANNLYVPAENKIDLQFHKTPAIFIEEYFKKSVIKNEEAKKEENKSANDAEMKESAEQPSVKRTRHGN